ncbi:hypothetical protein KM924_26055 [Brevibacillus parabrevis]|uniref:hypothetical protein n=1 Tax=Brevibacillus parabrevis TaxID=54914 RepID=UPI001C2330FB|nr:hypothetical protein [Brevibacillus parabrevis]MBU8715963.1 hypothetical protein [Brevibacillus parabrevis]
MLDLEVLFELFVLFEDELLLLLEDLTLEDPEPLLEVLLLAELELLLEELLLPEEPELLLEELLLPEELELLLEEDDPAAAYPSAMTN